MIDGIDIVYLAWNRLDFTRFTFETLLKHTNWDRVGRLIVYDDGSTDGTREWLIDNIDRAPVETDIRLTSLASPVSIMLNYVNGAAGTDWFVKLDNDIALPDGWLDELADLAEANPEIDLLGMEAGMTSVGGQHGEPWAGERWTRDCSHIGGIGLMRMEAFGLTPRLFANGRRYGFTEWQHRAHPNRGWIEPDLRCPLLDRLPFEPFTSLSARYVAEGWQRDWPKYDPVWMAWSWDWFNEFMLDTLNTWQAA